MNNLLFLFVGWALGLFSPLIIDLLQRPAIRRRLKKTLFIELRELRFQVAGMALLVAGNRQMLTKETLNWIAPIMLSERSPYATWFDEKSFRQMMEFSDKDLMMATLFKSPDEEGIELKKLYLPFLSSQVSALHLFSPEFQQLALEIMAHTQRINDFIDLVQGQQQKTFDSAISKENRQTILRNYSINLISVLGVCRQVADKVGIILSMDK